MTTLVDAPERVDGVQLIGEMAGSGYRTPPALVRRADGQVLQLTPLLYLVLAAADGRRGCAEIAATVGRAVGRGVTEDDVRTLVDGRLRPLGLLRRADGSRPEVRRSDPLIGLKPRFAVTDPQTTRRLTDPFRPLFHPVVVAAVVAIFAAVVGWVFFERGLTASAYDAFERPHLLLLVFVVSVLSAGFHEFGHAAAARYGGAEPGAMGAGLYLVWPAFYTDVTDSYRLGRAGRIRTDLGGLYFNAFVVVLTFGWWWWTGWEALLLLVATQVLQMVQQLLPLLRFDGYHVLADLAGVPDLYQRIRPTLAGLLPHRWRSPENRVLTPWARAVITLWVLVTVPLMALMLFAVIASVPRILATAGAAIGRDADAVAGAWRDGSGVDVAAHSLQVLAVLLPSVGCLLILGRLALRLFGGLAGWSRGSRTKRVVAAALGSVLVTGAAWAWWPQPGSYEPIQPGERGLFALLPEVGSDPLARPAVGPAGASARERLASDRPLVAAFPEGRELPTRAEPELALVLVPTAAGTAGEGPVASPGADTAEPWVFPFDQPLPPAEGDNQALAVNTTDGTTTYDLAFALVWADGSEVLNVNEAHAYASCTDCVAVAVAFQVVLVMDDAQVIVPQNLSVAANYQCHRCITAAIASQLVLTVGEEPDATDLRALGEVWDRLHALAADITSYSLEQIRAELEAVKAEIVAILGETPPLPEPSEAPASDPAEVEVAAEPTESPAPSPTAPAPSPSGDPDPTPTGPETAEVETAEPAPATPTPSPSVG